MKIKQIGTFLPSRKRFDNPQEGRVYSPSGLCPCLRDDSRYWFMAKKYRIRKLTAKECFRLMGVRDEDIERIQQAGISESQQYKMAGNSIVVDVLEGIFTQMFRKDDDVLF